MEEQTKTQTLTVHILNSLPYHNINRDDTGMPKTLTLGNTRRAMVSSQALKRAARVAYEKACANDSTKRSAKYWETYVTEVVKTKLAQLQVSAVEKDIVAQIMKALKALTSSKENVSEDKATSVWLSATEVAELVLHIINNQVRLSDKAKAEELLGDLGLGQVTGSLAIASFGRMFANAQHRQTEAAIAVSPAVTTHPIVIERDYFTVADDLTPADSSGAAYLDMAQYTTGVYYRSFTIDRAQLQRSWSEYGSANAQVLVQKLVESLIYDLPQGKSNASAAETLPLLVLAEIQNHRLAYDFETPVAAKAQGGYGENSVKHLLKKRLDVQGFDADLLGDAVCVGDTFGVAVDAKKVEVAGLVEFVAKWALGCSV